jgi:thiamine biosynthesis lipoprotein
LTLPFITGQSRLDLMSRRSSRRDFLRGRAAARTVADLTRRAAPGGDVDPWLADATAESYLVEVSRPAMACEFKVFLNAGQYEQGTETALLALDLVDALEDQMSVFRPESEISRLNRLAAEGPVEVEPRLFALLELALQLHADTGGAFDVTCGPLWKAWGFARREGRVPSDDELAEAMARVGSDLVELDQQQMTVRFRQPGVELNLGSIGKGYALDRFGELLKGAGVNDFLLHGGQSSVLAQGSRLLAEKSASAPAPFGWSVGLGHPTRRARRLAELRLRDRALGTSGTRTQYFRHKGRRYGHILDPRTGEPADELLSATVVAPSGAEADALSTAFYVMGAEKALEYCRARPELAAALVSAGDGPDGLEVRSIGLEEDELRLVKGDR